MWIGLSRLPGIRVLPLQVVYAAVALWPLIWTDGTLFLAANVLIASSFFTTGAIIAADPDQRGTARAMIAAGLVWPLNWVNEWHLDPLPLIAQLVGPLALILVVWALLRYPILWPRRWQDHSVFAILTLAQASALAVVVTSEPEWHGLPAQTLWLALWPNRALFEFVTHYVYDDGGALIAGLAILGVALRFTRLGRADRHAMSPIVGAVALAALATAWADIQQATPQPDGQLHNLFLLQMFSLLVIPLAFLTAAFRRWLILGEVPLVVERLRRAASPDELLVELRESLGDPSLQVAYRLDATTLVDARGQPVVPPGPGRFAVELRGGGGKPLGVVSTDPSLRRHPHLAGPVLRAAGLVLENLRLQAQVLARIAETERSSERISEAVAREVRRLSDDLAHGALRRLDLVTRRLDELTTRAGPGAAAQLETVRAQAHLAAEELAALAEGRAPAILHERGLRAAIEALAGPGDTIDLLNTRLPPNVERAAYFTVAELMANAHKHAGAATVAVAGRTTPDTLHIEVADDGCGGADPDGSGLSGIANRLTRSGGLLTIESTPGTGTQATLQLPLS